VPASRSRTERWRDCLRQVYERDGALEISVPASHAEGSTTGPRGSDLIWRVRVVGLSETEIHIEPPSAAGTFIPLEPGLRLVAVLAIGQNRWMFHTRILPQQAGRPSRSIRLAMPPTVERCQRRNFFRISTAELCLPAVECWPLLDPTTVGPAEVANRTQIIDLLDSPPGVKSSSPEPLILPEVGPRFRAMLMNVGGGGAGLIVERSESGAADRARLYWLRINLTPHIPAPIAVTARLVHTHIDSAQNLYAGMAFEWSFHPAHKDFLVEQICRYVGALHRDQANEPRQTA
jgi:flagellar protein YcgR